MVDCHIEENQQSQETFEQCHATYQMFNRDSIVAESHLVTMFYHATQSARIGTTKRLESSDRGSLQLSIGTHRGVRCPCRHGLTKRGRLQVDARVDRGTYRLSQGDLLNRHRRQHMVMGREGCPAEEITGGVRAGREQIRVSDELDGS